MHAQSTFTLPQKVVIVCELFGALLCRLSLNLPILLILEMLDVGKLSQWGRPPQKFRDRFWGFCLEIP